jgi:NCS1 family nucleobase:cation symporter-1
MWHIAALWIGMAVCIPTYMLAGSLIDGGMDWRQALFTIAAGNVVVLVPMVLNAVPGTKYGIPFPVLARASFGTIGSNVPALLRGFVACGWFGIQTWIGGAAFYQMGIILWPGLAGLGDLPAFIGINVGQFACFMLFWAWNVYVIVRGMDSIKWLEALAAPFLIVIGLGFLWWAHATAGGWGPMLSQPATQPFMTTFWPSLTAMVGFWATLSLNIPDFSRFAGSQRDQAWGQALGLPTTMALYSFIGVAVTSATSTIFGAPVWDPITLIGRLAERGDAGPFVVLLSAFTMAVATISTNIAANVVSPANDFANVAPRLISFRTGGLITAVLGIAMMPWKLVADPTGYIFTWLIGYGTLLGPIAGIMIADYFVVRRGVLKLADLYDPNGAYRYRGGWNPAAIAALAIGILPNLPGFLMQVVGPMKGAFPPVFSEIYQFGWFVGFAVAFAVHAALMRR